MKPMYYLHRLEVPPWHLFYWQMFAEDGNRSFSVNR